LRDRRSRHVFLLAGIRLGFDSLTKESRGRRRIERYELRNQIIDRHFWWAIQMVDVIRDVAWDILPLGAKGSFQALNTAG
jgi:hypothetical protein